MSLRERRAIIFFDETLKNAGTICAITNFCLDGIWKSKYQRYGNQYQ
jgi:hypothetical protein